MVKCRQNKSVYRMAYLPTKDEIIYSSYYYHLATWNNHKNWVLNDLHQFEKPKNIKNCYGSILRKGLKRDISHICFKNDLGLSLKTEKNFQETLFKDLLLHAHKKDMGKTKIRES